MSCKNCSKPLVKEVFEFNGVQYHPQCFTCQTCKISLSEKQFGEFEGKFYCEQDYDTVMSQQAPICVSCGMRVTEQVFIDQDQNSYHLACFNCSKCGKQLSKNYFKKEGKPVCQECGMEKYTELRLSIATKCSMCKKDIAKGTTEISIENNKYSFHPNCFNCLVCSTPLDSETYKLSKGRVVCAKCAV